MFKNLAFLMDAAGDGSGGGSGTGGGTGGAAGGGDNGGGTGGGQGAGSGGGAAAPWFDTFQDPALKEWVASYKDAYPTPEAMALKALNLEKFVGADKAGRGVIVPKPEAKPEEWQAFYRKVGGVPEKADGYKVHSDPKIAAELAADPLIKQFQEQAHKMGMPPQFLQGAVEWYVGAMKGAQEGQYAALEQRAETDLVELHQEWQGPKYDENVELGRRAAKMFIPHENPQQMEEILNKMEGALGTKFTLKLWAQIGQGLSEHGFVDDPMNNGGGGGMTPEGARLKIRELKMDQNFQKRFTSGDVGAKTEWGNLHKLAYPEQAT